MTRKNYTKFEKELTCQFKVGKRNLTNFDSSTQKSQKISTLMGCFWPKYIMFELKKHRGNMFDGTEDWCKIWRKAEEQKQNKLVTIWKKRLLICFESYQSIPYSHTVTVDRNLNTLLMVNINPICKR